MIKPVTPKTLQSLLHSRCRPPITNSPLTHLRHLSTNSAIARGISRSRETSARSNRTRPSFRERDSRADARSSRFREKPAFREKNDRFRGDSGRVKGDGGREFAPRREFRDQRAGASRGYGDGARSGYNASSGQRFARGEVQSRRSSRPGVRASGGRGWSDRRDAGSGRERSYTERGSALEEQKDLEFSETPLPERGFSRNSPGDDLGNLENRTSRSRLNDRKGPKWQSEDLEIDSRLPSSSQRDAPRITRHFPQPMPYTTAASEFMFGARVSLAALRAARRKFYKLYIDARKISQSGTVAQMVHATAQKARIDIEELAEGEVSKLDQISKGRPHDGVVLEVSPAPKLPIRSLGEKDDDQKIFKVDVAPQSAEDLEINGAAGSVRWNGSDWRHPCVLWLHGVVDIQNVGALLRSAFYYSVDAVVMSARATAPLNLGVSRSSAGASEHVHILTVEDPATFMKQSSKNGWRFHAAVPRSANQSKDARAEPKRLESKFISDLSPKNHPLKASPVVIVLGNEDQGLPNWLQRQSQYRWTIGSGENALKWGVDSLNVSVAGAIFMDRFLQKPSES